MTHPHHERGNHAKLITLIGALINFLQGTIKIIAGHLCYSHALIADGFHSFADLLTDGMVLFASHFGSQAADERHPYGHRRIETAATFLLSLLLILVGAGIGMHAIEEMHRSSLELPTRMALLIAIASILANECSFWMTLRVGKKIQSPLIQANAWHHRSDSGASLIVAIGIIGGLCGYPLLDTISAVIVALLIIKMGIDYGWDSVKELVDTAVSPVTTQLIQQTILKTPGVNKIHQLRTRSMGEHILVDVHILVFPYLSVSEGHYIAQNVHHRLMETLPQITDVTVHVDPEDDEIHAPSFHLPSRPWIEKNWLLPLQQQYPDIQTWSIHYLAGKVVLDLYLQQPTHALKKIQDSCKQLCQDESQLGTIRLFGYIESSLK